MGLRDRPLRYIAGRTCLDFVNTANWSTAGDLLEDKLESDADIVLWCRDMGLGSIEGTRGRLDEIRRFRAALRRVILARLADHPPEDADVAILNGALGTLPASVIRRDGSGYAPALTLVQAIAISAAALLSRDSEIERVKVCPGDDCAWLFLDESKNRRRTWCSMEACGNRAKAKRHYRRRTAKSS